MNFFIVSAGKPGSDYIDNNFTEIIDTNEFALHENTQQKGTYFSIEKKDVLILKYEGKLVAYGIVLKRFKNNAKVFSLRAKVNEWVFFNKENNKEGVSLYGIQRATIGGGRYGTVKTIRPNFGTDKIREIDSSHTLFQQILDNYQKAITNLQKDGDYFQLHEEIFNFLLDKSESDPEFTFVIRNSNNRSKLDMGYWFYGEETIAISFWTGIDNLNKIPAISFLINPNNHCKLVIQTDVYINLKNYFKENEIAKTALFLEEKGNTLECIYKKYKLTEYIECLKSFLLNHYPIINNILEDIRSKKTILTSVKPYDLNDNFISKFPIDEFDFRLNNLFKYRQKDSAHLDLTLYSIEDEKKADRLKEIFINNYGLIKNEELFFDDSKWVFITGENGVGKTMLLRAIGSALGNRTLSPKELKTKDFSIKALFYSAGRTISFSRTGNENVRAKRAILSRGLAMYGPYRLEQGSNKIKDETFRKALSKVGKFESLFEEGSKLLSFDKQLEIWSKDSKLSQKILRSRIEQVSSLLPKLIPDLRLVKYKQKKENKYEFEYLIQSRGTDELTPLKWHELSSGNKNILNLVSDIIIRFFYQQPKIIDPSELRGIVLIDEIDLHLHPKAQRDLVVTLSETFPLIQFIVTTHSPIPLLGAPENSSFFVVKRDWKKGVYVTRLFDLEKNFKNLLPNALLTSDLFDLEEIIHKDIKNQDINTSDTFDKYKLDQELNKQLNILKANDDETFNNFIK